MTNNNLNWLSRNGNATNFGPAQSANNYTYDQIGNLTADNQARISAINWSVYGKITDMLDSTKTIAYKYNTAQQRVTKTANGLTTYYVRDAQGNTLALYDNKASQTNWREQHLYGSSRLGMWQPNVNLATNNASTVWDTIGHKNYELSNHLGNVAATITDARTAHTGYYTADITTAQDYYAFGALMPNRTFTLSSNYRYGFNRKENDNEVKGAGNQQDYGMRIYDPRVGRFLSVDPLTKSYPSLTPYQFASNTPIFAVDLDGLEASGNPRGDIVAPYLDGHRHTTIPWQGLHKEVQSQLIIAGPFAGAIAGSEILWSMFKTGTAGAVISGSISLLKNQTSDEVGKSIISGFIGGSVFGVNEPLTLGQLVVQGSISGAIGEYTNQIIENDFEKGKGYNLGSIVKSAGVGAVSSVIAGKLFEAVSGYIDKKVALEIAKTTTSSYRNIVKAAVLKDAPSLTGQSLKKAINKNISEIQGLIKSQGAVEKVILKTTIEKNIDVIQDQVTEKIKN